MAEILQLSSIIGTFLLLCGVLKFYIYYKTFGVSILRFIEIEEVLTLFMDNIIAYLCIIIPTTLYIYLTNQGQKIFNALHYEIYVEKFVENWMLEIAFLILCSLGVIFYVRQRPRLKKHDLTLLLILVGSCTFVLPLVLMVLSDLTKNTSKENTLSKPAYMSVLCFLLLIYTIITAINEAAKVSRHNYYKGVKITFKDGLEPLESDSFNFFIGMTKSYVFIYSKNLKQCTAYRMENVLKIVFPLLT